MTNSLFSLSFPPESPAETVPLVQLAEQMDYSGVWIPDSHLLWRESYTSLALYASQTRKIGLGFAVTNILTRHISIIASAAATLNEISGGRIVLGVGSGATGVGTVGLRRASLSQLETSVTAIRDLLLGRSIPVESNPKEIQNENEYRPEEQMSLHWRANPPPIFLSAHGPLALKLAGRIADGVVYSLGALPEMVKFANVQISKGLDESKRDPSRVQRWCRVALALGDDKKTLIEEVRPYIATVETNLAFLGSSASISSTLRNETLETLRRYDLSEHIQTGAEHAKFVSDGAVEQLALVGSPRECLSKLEELKKAGATNFNLVIFNARDKKNLIQRFAEQVKSQMN